MPQNDINKTFKTNQFRHENVVPNELMTVEFRVNDPMDLTDNPKRMWARTDTGELFYTVDGTNINKPVKTSDLPYFNVKAFGSTGNGVTDDYTALSDLITKIGISEATILFSPGTYKIGSNITIPSNINLYLSKGAVLAPVSGVTITINGSVEAGLWQIFSGAGKVIGSIKVDCIYPQWWGAKGDGITDDTVAFIATIATAESAAVIAPDGLSNKRGKIKIFIPAGSYLITSAEALMRSSYTQGTYGMDIQGAGRGITGIVFHPTTPGYLMNNNNAWLGITVSDIEFICNDANSSFMRSYSTGSGQNYVFDRCSWRGTWKYGVYLEGTNTNSEMTWYACKMTGTWTKYIYSPSATGSDQFLNYNFFATDFEGVGDFLHFDKGGNINVWGGSYIHTNIAAGAFFRLKGNSHAYGVQRFLCIGARFEHRFTTSMLVDCEWNDGTVAFINCDMGSQSPIPGAGTMVSAQFNSVNQKMPDIKFDNCVLMGQHRYIWGSNSFLSPHNVKYENCEVTNFNKPSDFIVFSGSTNFGGRPVIKFRNCRGTSDLQTYIWECDYNFNGSMIGETSKKIISLRNVNGALPGASDGTIQVFLPLNVIVTRVTLYSLAGGAPNSNAASFTVQSSEGTPTVLGTVSVANYQTGFNSNTDNFFVCNSDAKRQIVLTTTATQGNGNGYCLIEYLG